MIGFSRVESVAHGRLGLSKRLEEALKTIGSRNYSANFASSRAIKALRALS
jgi:hypothetical protein